MKLPPNLKAQAPGEGDRHAAFRVERTRSDKFPYRLSVEQDGRTIFSVWTKEKWPGAHNVFCLRDQGNDDEFETLTLTKIEHLTRNGAKLVLALDRPSQK